MYIEISRYCSSPIVNRNIFHDLYTIKVQTQKDLSSLHQL